MGGHEGETVRLEGFAVEEPAVGLCELAEEPAQIGLCAPPVPRLAPRLEPLEAGGEQVGLGFGLRVWIRAG